ncbi:MAG TPA: glutaredoxin domain-containing protein [Solirubrobacteraceae bacterium]|nr:glutaredoxin domain-containing protein [Solirubrobacteraceae bacterium]
MTPELELWQTEWCPASHRIRQRLTELELPFLAQPVPVDPADRDRLERASGQRSVPVLRVADTMLVGEQAIREYLDNHYTEPPDAASQRDRATRAKRRELEEACPKLQAATA